MRPSGQRKAPDRRRADLRPVARASTSRPSSASSSASASALGEPRRRPPTSPTHVFGVVGLNDWSARDIQAWEYVPLGPFLGKSFATSIARWVTPLAALDAAWADLPGQDDPEPLDYLRVDGAAPGLDIDVEVVLERRGGRPAAVPHRCTGRRPRCSPTLTVNGASLRTGDLYGSGTISGPEPDQRGSLLELSWGGKEPFTAAVASAPSSRTATR